MKLRAEIPSFLHKQKQFSTNDANRTRLLTKLRWVVESGKITSAIFSFNLFRIVNSKIKCWKYFAQTIRNSNLPTVGLDLDIICAMQNKYFRPALSDRLGGEEMAENMKSLLNAPNLLQEFLEVNHGLKWKKFDSLYCTFPILVEDDIREITFG
jgi:hypothetical protein